MELKENCVLFFKPLVWTQGSGTWSKNLIFIETILKVFMWACRTHAAQVCGREKVDFVNGWRGGGARWTLPLSCPAYNHITITKITFLLERGGEGQTDRQQGWDGSTDFCFLAKSFHFWDIQWPQHSPEFTREPFERNFWEPCDFWGTWGASKPPWCTSSLWYTDWVCTGFRERQKHASERVRQIQH